MVEGGGELRAMIVLLEKQVHLQKDVADAVVVGRVSESGEGERERRGLQAAWAEVKRKERDRSRRMRFMVLEHISPRRHRNWLVMLFANVMYLSANFSRVANALSKSVSRYGSGEVWDVANAWRCCPLVSLTSH